jgi:hypothetical protein
MEHLVKSGIAHHNKDYNCAVRILLWFWLRQVRVPGMTRPAQVMIGLLTEGTTDSRFLASLVRRTFEHIAFECWGDVEILDLVILRGKKDKFVEEVMAASVTGLEEHGITVLCVHADADSDTDHTVYSHKIEPAKKALNDSARPRCTNLVPIVPVHMQEAWLLADIALLKKQIGTGMHDAELGIDKKPESIPDPKQIIEEAIRIARQELTKRRRHDLQIGDLYQLIGQSISLMALQDLPSYKKFEEHVRCALRELKLLA